MAKVIKKFRDKNTKKIYRPGDDYEGNKERLKELSEKGFIESEDGGDSAERFPKHVGGGFYELPNGEKVRGKEAALKAMEEQE